MVAIMALAFLIGGLQVIYTSLAIGGMFAFLSVVVLSLTWLERKTLARIQMRMGPMRVGPHGLLQPFADVIKLMGKEDILPAWVDRTVYWIAPLALFVPSFAIWVVIPLGPGLVIRDLELGLLYVLALSVVSILGLIMAGWASANKYSVLGGLRSAAQLVSYEIPLIVVALSIAALAGSLNLTTIVEMGSPVPYVLLQPLGFIIFFLAGLAEVGRTPFDIYHADSEVIGGPFVDYSGAHWTAFFLAEYINTFLLAALLTLLFLGGWSGPWLPGAVWFIMKVYAVIMVVFWFRGTFPRLRIDQLMSLGWKVLVPLSFLNLVLTASALFYGWPSWVLGALGLAVVAAVFAASRRASTRSRPSLTLVPAREVRRA
jgi:NADH-quinone oxidoreductase subunit H